MSFLKENFEKPIEIRTGFRLRKLKGKFYFDMLLVCSILLLLFTSSPASAGMQILGKWDFGPTFDVAQSGNYLYVAAGEQVRIYDISTKDKLAKISWNQTQIYHSGTTDANLGTYKEGVPPVKILHLGSAIYDMLINGSYLYVSAYNMFSVIDITDPLNSYMMSNVSGTDFDGAMINGSTIYVAMGTLSGSGGVKVIDVSNKSNIYVTNSITLSGSKRGRNVAQYGNYLYVSKMVDNGVDIINLQNSMVVATLNVSYNNFANGWSMFSGIRIKGKYMYLIEYHEGLRVFDISNPLIPVQVGNIMGSDSEYNYNDIELVGNYAYISERYMGPNIVNISSPTTISKSSIISRLDTRPGYSEGIFPASLSYGDYIFMSTNSAGVEVINSTNKVSPSLVSYVQTPGEGDSIVVNGSYAYIGGRNIGVWVVNISNPANPKTIALVETQGRTSGLVIQGKYLFASGGWSPLASIDISDPDNPVLVQARVGHNIAGNLIAAENYLYNGDLYYDCYDNGTCYSDKHKVVTYDITNKSNITVLNKTDLGMGFGSFISVRYKDNYLLGGSGTCFCIIDISNRAAPKIVSNIKMNLYMGDVSVVGDIAYIASENTFYTYNISKVTNPVQLGVISVTMPSSVNVYQNISYLFPRIDKYGFRAVDVQNPYNMKVLDTLPIGGDTYTGAMVESNGLFYSGSGWIVSPGPQPPTTSSLGDLNNDGKVNSNDLIIIGLKFAEKTKYPYPSYDFDMNGIVNVLDAIKIANMII